MAGGAGLTAALRHRDYRYLISAFTLSDIGSWAYSVALTVWVYDATGSVGWLAVSTACRFVPSMLVGAWAGVVAERADKVRLMRSTDLAFAAVMAVLALVMTFDGPLLAVLAVATVSSVLGTLYEPAAAALTPHVVGERDLASANALRNTIDNLTVIAGPAMGAALLLLGPPQNAVWINAATFLVSAVLVSRVRTRAEGVDTSEGGELGVWQQATTGARAIVADRSAAVLVAYCLLVTLVYGTDTVVFVAASDEILGTGPDGFGYLLAGLGVGGLLAAPLVTRAESRAGLGPIIMAGVAGYCLPTMVMLVSDEPVVAFVAQVVRGAATLFVDVLAITALQRSLPPTMLARVFGVFDVLATTAVLIGSALASVVVASFGVDAGIWVTGAGMFAVGLLGVPWLREVDRAAAARRAELAPYVALLEACDLFEQVGDGDLTQLAGAAEQVEVPAGAVVVAEGEEADALYVVVAGRLAVSGAGIAVPDLHAGDYFGEIGLVEQIPRTATVTAATDATVLRVDGETFVDVLTSARPSAAVLDGASLRLRRTHPSLTATRLGALAAPAETGDTP